MAEHLTSPRAGVPDLADSTDAVLHVADSLAAGRGPVAVDTERASGFRFDDRAFLVQLRREGSGTHLVDPATVADAGTILAPVMNDAPWILHAAHSDLPALTSLGWHTPQLHDTQIAGRLLGYGQIGLAGMLDEFLGVTVAKDKGREDWSARPIPDPMLNYAALDVELLIELLDAAGSRLSALGRGGWYRQECDHVNVSWSHPVPAPDWRKLRGIGHVRDRRGLEMVRRLVEARTGVARSRDVPPEHVLRGSAILELAEAPRKADSRLRSEIARSSRLARASRGSSVARELQGTLSRAVHLALDAGGDALPDRPSKGVGRPDHRTWARDYPVADRLLSGFTAGLAEVSETTGIRTEDLLTARKLRAVAWDVSRAADNGAVPVHPDDPVGELEELLGGVLSAQDCREWQSGLLVPAFLPVIEVRPA